MASDRAPVITDVAAHAGVSHQTVSRVLNKPDLVRPATRERVLAAIRELGYRPNASARALATRRTRLLGVLNAGVDYFGPAHAATAIEVAAREFGYATITTGVEGAATSPGDTLDYFLNLGVDGLVIVAPTVAVASAARTLAGTLPIVIIATGLDSPEPMHLVGVDHEHGAREAIRHLIDLGHRDIAHLSGPDDWFDARARLAGWRAELTAAGLDVPEPIRAGWEARDGYYAAGAILEATPRPTAVFAANDLVALGLIRRLTEAGLRVPEDVAVVGYDDTAGADFFSPPLTTIRQPFEAVGQRAVNVVVEAMTGRSPANVLIVPTLVIRESSGARR